MCDVTYTQADDVTADMELSLFDDMDGSRFLFFYLKRSENWLKTRQYICDVCNKQIYDIKRKKCLCVFGHSELNIPRGSGLCLLWKRPGQGSLFSGLEQTARPVEEHWMDQTDGRGQTHSCQPLNVDPVIPFII